VFSIWHIGKITQGREFWLSRIMAVIAVAGLSWWGGHTMVTNPFQLKLGATLLAGLVIVLKPELSLYALPIVVALPRGRILPPGVNPIEFVLAASATGLAAWWGLRRLRGQESDRLAILLGVLVFWPGVILFTGYGVWEFARMALFSLAPALPAFLLGRYLPRSRRQVLWMMKATIIGGLLLLAGLSWNFAFDPQAEVFRDTGQFLMLRVNFSGYMYAYAWTGLLIPPLSLASLWAFRGSRWRRIPALTLILVTFVLVTLCSNRAGWIVIALAIVLTFRSLSQQHEGNARSVILLVVVGILVTGAFGALFGNALDSMLARMANLGNPGRLLNRVPDWVAGLWQAAERPLLGWGPGMISLDAGHNFFVDVARAYGFPYAAGWTLAIVVALRRAWALVQQAKTTDFNELAIPLWVTLMVGVAYSWSNSIFLGDPYFTAMFWLIAGVISRPGWGDKLQV